MKHGGRRKGAGAPRGNLNGLKHGRYSKQFAEIGALFAMDPTIRDALTALARRHDVKADRANETASLLLTRLIHHARVLSKGQLSLPVNVHAQDAINEAAARAAARQIQTTAARLRKISRNPPRNQAAATNGENQSSTMDSGFRRNDGEKDDGPVPDTSYLIPDR
jgi:hypothetical protein